MLCNRIALPEHDDALHQAVAALIGPTYRHLGFDATPGESERTPSLRALAINLMGTVGADAAVRAEAARRFDASPIGGGSGDPIPADIEAATLAVVAQLLRPGDYDALLERYRTASDATGGDALARCAGRLPRRRRCACARSTWP